jgi:hypothetical protein
MTRLTLKAGDAAEIRGPRTLLLWSCRCGHEKCVERHRLDSWDPSSGITLWSYITSAIKGPQVTIQAGSFLAGMYSSLLATEGNGYSMRVRLAPVEYKLCPNDDCRDPNTEQRLQASKDKPILKYEGEKCPQCSTPFNPETTRRKAFEQLILDTDFEIYERQARLHCKGCDNLFSAPACPICGATPRLRRPTHVWVRTFSTKRPLDDDSNLRDPSSDEDDEADDFDNDPSDAD